VNHVELVAQGTAALTMPPEVLDRSADVSKARADHMLGAREDIVLMDRGVGIDFGSTRVAVITGDVPVGTVAAERAPHIRLLMLVNDVSLRNLIPMELAKGFGFFPVEARIAFSSGCVTSG
jgi:fumarylacetoacetate (FAA) hydrolase